MLNSPKHRQIKPRRQRAARQPLLGRVPARMPRGSSWKETPNPAPPAWVSAPRGGVWARAPPLPTSLHDTHLSLVTRVSDGWSRAGSDGVCGKPRPVVSLQEQPRAAPASCLSSGARRAAGRFPAPGRWSGAGGMPGPGLGLFLPVVQDRLEFLSRSSGLFSALCQIVKGDCVTSPGAVPAPEDGDTRPQRKSM